ncbi:TPR repeat [Noviherbaspirillum humi]|uniref:TPR repeat n=2 Tax=Noviherbaspirillum humi TaxID=1688639 RepID=A0A239HZB1_9BURK|nr:TPR repeat [Noviherbaspirillum humi]
MPNSSRANEARAPSIAASQGEDMPGRAEIHLDAADSGNVDRLRMKLGVVVAGGVLVIAAAMLTAWPSMHKKGFLHASTKAAGQTSSNAPEATDAHFDKALRLVRTFFDRTHELPDPNPLATNPELVDIRNALQESMNRNSGEAKYLMGLLAYLSRERALQQKGAALIQAAADEGLFIARLDSAILLKKSYPLDDLHFRAALKAANAGVKVAQIEAARYFASFGRKDQAAEWAIKALANTHVGDPSDPLFAFRMALGGATTSTVLKQYEALAKYLLAAVRMERANTVEQRSQALALLEEASLGGIRQAGLDLARMKLSDKSERAHPEQALAPLQRIAGSPPGRNGCLVHFEECAESHRQEAMYLLAVNQIGGTPGFDSVGNPFPMLEELTSLQFNPAKALLGWCLVNGIGIPREARRGIGLLNEAAAAGDKDAKYWLGRAFLEGKGQAVDKDKGRALIKEAADLGNPNAAALLDSH